MRDKMIPRKSSRHYFYRNVARNLIKDSRYLNSNFDPAIKFGDCFANMKLDEIKAVLDERDRLEKKKARL